MSILPLPRAARYRADDFAPVISRRAVPTTSAAEIVARFECLSRTRTNWCNCDRCGQHIEPPAVICETCRQWSSLLAWLERARRSVGQST